ncbi:MAG: hypothetical protein M1818_006426 [Claussenomyces sp. TS43310]|nr:MAG: hypothetical protein M1818_006426 [Claussenomyces sp. TS43310]
MSFGGCLEPDRDGFLGFETAMRVIIINGDFEIRRGLTALAAGLGPAEDPDKSARRWPPENGVFPHNRSVLAKYGLHRRIANSLRQSQSAQNSAGIQTLLDAEREAQKIVQKDRTKRVKEARDEAKKEIDTYRKTKDEEFKKYETEHTSGNSKAEDDANKDAEVQIKGIKEAGKNGQDKVVADLLKAVFDVKPVVPNRIDAALVGKS